MVATCVSILVNANDWKVTLLWEAWYCKAEKVELYCIIYIVRIIMNQTNVKDSHDKGIQM